MQIPKKISQCPEEEKISNSKVKVLLLAFLVPVVFAAGCGGDEQAQDDSADNQTTQEQTAEQTANNETQAGKNTEEEAASVEATLKIEGDAGTEFSGVCSVGNEEDDISGEVPASFTYDLNGQSFECEIRKESSDAGSLKVTLTAPGTNIVQQTNAPGGSVNLNISASGTSSSTSSVTSSGSVNQVSSSSVSSSSVSVSSSSSSTGSP